MTTRLIPKLKAHSNRYLNFLIGSNTELVLENRLFNAVCLIAIFIMIVNIPFNYFSGLKTTSVLFTVFTALLVYIYYVGRFRRRFIRSVTITSGLVFILLATNYFFSAGIRGASLLSFILAFVLIIIVSPRKLYGIWLLSSLLLVFGLVWVEYHFPKSIQVSYVDDRSLFIDIAITYATGIVVSFLSLLYFKSAYNNEKKSSELKALELQRLNDEKVELFSIISHDLQAPLSSLHSYVRLIADERLTVDERKRIERGLADNLHGTQEMLSNLLVWSQSQLRGLHVDLARNNIYKVLKPVIDIQRLYAKQKNISLETHFDQTSFALVDRDMLQLIVRNLINNAIKFSPQGTIIRVSTTGTATACLIIVEDNGTGIAKDRQVTLFSLKTRSTYGTNNERGIGLGLFLCKEYTLAQGGQIWFESETGKGTKFFVSFPRSN